MKLSKQTKDEIRVLPIISVAEKLGMYLYGMGKLNRRCVCPFHDDHKPSLHLNATKNIFKCFSCGKGGDVIRLVQDYKSLPFHQACQWLIDEFGINVIEESRNYGNTALRSSGTTDITSAFCPLPSDLVTQFLSMDSVFCKSVVSSGYLTQGQIVAAANRYRLGASKDGGVIFWQIDELQRIHTGKIMYYQPDCHRDKSHTPTWVHTLLKRQLPASYTLHRCLFGQHLLSGRVPGTTVCIVESEKTAVICSEHISDCLWLACGGLQMFSPEMLALLVDYKVLIFPDTDLTGDTYRHWNDIVQQATKRYEFKYPLRISRLLEDRATPEQKSHKIDLVDFLYENTEKH